jgi:hypothetical protein
MMPVPQTRTPSVHALGTRISLTSWLPPSYFLRHSVSYPGAKSFFHSLAIRHIEETAKLHIFLSCRPFASVAIVGIPDMPIDARLGLLLGLMVVALAGMLSAQPRSSAVSRHEVAIRSDSTDWARVPRTGPETGPRYRVQEGDTLASIADKYYGDRHKSGELFRMNRDTITDPALLVPGTLLRVPGPADAR